MFSRSPVHRTQKAGNGLLSAFGIPFAQRPVIRVAHRFAMGFRRFAKGFRLPPAAQLALYSFLLRFKRCDMPLATRHSPLNLLRKFHRTERTATGNVF